MLIKKGDKVKITRGKDRGREGKVLQVLPKAKKVIIEGLNLRYRHLRPKRANEKGQRVEYPAPINVSNVMHIDPKTDKATRVGSKEEQGIKQRVSRKSSEVI